jgi:TPR repeat protein
VAEWTTDANNGNSVAQFYLGTSYYNGEGVPQDAKKAVYWYTLSAEQGNSGGQRNLGIMYYTGEGIEPNFELAYMWGNLAAANGAEPDVRDAAAEELNSEQLARAQKMSSDWVAVHP